MADIISDDRPASTRRRRQSGQSRLSQHPGTADDNGESGALLPLVEMLFFAYRDFTGEADVVLAAYGLGRAHHRVLHFVNRSPGIRVADLLQVLKITKQSLGRVLRKLVDDGWIEQAPGPDDRRDRRLTLTAAGHGLAAELIVLQTRRIAHALSEIEASAGANVRDNVRGFLFAMIAPDERASVTAIVEGSGSAGDL